MTSVEVWWFFDHYADLTHRRRIQEGTKTGGTFATFYTRNLLQLKDQDQVAKALCIVKGLPGTAKLDDDTARKLVELGAANVQHELQMAELRLGGGGGRTSAGVMQASHLRAGITPECRHHT